MKVTLVSWTNDMVRVVAAAYRTCVGPIRFPQEFNDAEAAEIFDFVLRGAHTPSLETASMTFAIEGLSRVVSHQIVRHRVGVSFSQMTQRAVSLEDFADKKFYITPPEIAEGGVAVKDSYEEAMLHCQNIYKFMVASGVPEEIARYVIPSAVKTNIYMTANFQALRHICGQRLCLKMQGEMVDLVSKIRDAVAGEFPVMADYLRPKCLENGRCDRNENNDNTCPYTSGGRVRRREAR